MANALTIKNLSKIYTLPNGTKVAALKDVSIEIESGSFVALLGVNGAGKSTMIDIISSVTKKTSGTVVIDGVDADKQPLAVKYRMGIVPQEICLDAFFTVWEMLCLHSKYYGILNNEKRILMLLDKLELMDKKNAAVKTLSGGMKRRLMIIKALLHDPRIIILDEPTAGVDVELRHKLWQYIKEIHREGKTILLTTHYLEEAQDLCKKVAILNKGELLCFESKEDLLAKQAGSLHVICDSTISVEVVNEVKNLVKGQNWGIAIDDKSIAMMNKSEALFAVLSVMEKHKLAIKIVSNNPSLEDVFLRLTNGLAR